MPNFSANLTMLFGEHVFTKRFEACKKAGFSSVEYLFPYDYTAQRLRDLLRKYGLKQVLFNLPAGDWEAGDRGIAVDPDRTEEFRKGVGQALVYARELGVQRINCLAGKRIEGISYEKQWQTLVNNLRYAAGKTAEENRIVLVEPINTFDIPGFFLTTTREGLTLLNEVGAENLKLQYDVYHMQKMEGNLVDTIRKNLYRIGHIQIADNPGRHQPGTGEINYHFLLNEIDRMGYEGFIGLEYIPKPDTLSSLKWMEDWSHS